MSDSKSIDECLALFGLEYGCSTSDIKRAYRALAKRHHPDLHQDDYEKKLRTGYMARIIEARDLLLKHIDLVCVQKVKKQPVKKSPRKKPPVEKSDRVNKKRPEHDYDIYRKGLQFYNMYFLILTRPLKTTQAKLDTLKIAEQQFNRLLENYPESTWVDDVREKLANIEKARKRL